jgi:hypothetical protein
MESRPEPINMPELTGIAPIAAGLVGFKPLK